MCWNVEALGKIWRMWLGVRIQSLRRPNSLNGWPTDPQVQCMIDVCMTGVRMIDLCMGRCCINFRLGLRAHVAKCCCLPAERKGEVLCCAGAGAGAAGGGSQQPSIESFFKPRKKARVTPLPQASGGAAARSPQ